MMKLFIIFGNITHLLIVKKLIQYKNEIAQMVVRPKLGVFFLGVGGTQLARLTQGRWQGATEHGCCRKNNKVIAARKIRNPATHHQESNGGSGLDRKLPVIQCKRHLLLPVDECFPKWTYMCSHIAPQMFSPSDGWFWWISSISEVLSQLDLMGGFKSGLILKDISKCFTLF